MVSTMAFCARKVALVGPASIHREATAEGSSWSEKERVHDKRHIGYHHDVVYVIDLEVQSDDQLTSSRDRSLQVWRVSCTLVLQPPSHHCSQPNHLQHSGFRPPLICKLLASIEILVIAGRNVLHHSLTHLMWSSSTLSRSVDILPRQVSVPLRFSRRVLLVGRPCLRSIFSNIPSDPG